MLCPFPHLRLLSLGLLSPLDPDSICCWAFPPEALSVSSSTFRLQTKCFVPGPGPRVGPSLFDCLTAAHPGARVLDLHPHLVHLPSDIIRSSIHLHAISPPLILSAPHFTSGRLYRHFLPTFPMPGLAFCSRSHCAPPAPRPSPLPFNHGHASCGR